MALLAGGVCDCGKQGVWLRAWQALLARLDERRLLNWELKSFIEPTVKNAATNKHQK
jgi:hypothetical protein